MTAARFVADENLPGPVTSGLRRLGFDIVTFASVNRLGYPDEAQLAWATVEARVILTHDPDYVDLGYAAEAHAGVGFCSQKKYSGRAGALIRRLEELHSAVSAEEWANRVIFL